MTTLLRWCVYVGGKICYNDLMGMYEEERGGRTNRKISMI